MVLPKNRDIRLPQPFQVLRALPLIRYVEGMNLAQTGVFHVLKQMVNLLLSKGASLNVCDKKERQPLHWAAFLGEKRITGRAGFGIPRAGTECSGT